jgi:hypothetical protein
MANEKQVTLLKQGVEGWNAWRRGNPDIRPDLRRADLSGIGGFRVTLLIDADLRDVDLCEADLSKGYLLRAGGFSQTLTIRMKYETDASTHRSWSCAASGEGRSGEDGGGQAKPWVTRGRKAYGT